MRSRRQRTASTLSGTEKRYFRFEFSVIALAALCEWLGVMLTDFGKLMDPLADKLLVMSALVAFIPVAGVPVWVVVVILAREFMVTSLRLIAAGKGVVIAADKWGKIKTISQMIWLNYTLLMLWLFPEAGWAYTVFVVLMGIVVATTVLSGANYMLKNKELYSDR